MTDDEDDISSTTTTTTTTTTSFQSKGFPNLLLVKTRLSPNHYRYSLLNNELVPLRVIFSVHSLKEKFTSRMKILCGSASTSSSEEKAKTENRRQSSSSSSATTEKLVLQISTPWISPNSSTDILEGFLGRWKAKVEKQQQEDEKEQSGREEKGEKGRRSNVNDNDEEENTSSTSSDDDDNESDSNNNDDDDDNLHQVLQRIEDEISLSSSNLLLRQGQDQKQRQEKNDDDDDDVRKRSLKTKAKFVDHIEMHPRRLLPTQLEPPSNENKNCKTLFSLRRVSELCRNLKSSPTTTKQDVTGRTNHNVHNLHLQSQLHRIQLGKTGSCYFIAALISILNSFIIRNRTTTSTTTSATSSNDGDDVVIMKQFLEKFFVLEECDFDRGIYICRFFDHEHSYTWKSITVDDYLVVVKKKNPKRQLSLLFSRVVFSHHHDNEGHQSNMMIMEEGDAVDKTSTVVTALSHFWVSILEKAYVKFRLLQSTTVGQRDRYDTTHDDDDDTENKNSNSNTTTSTLYELIRKGSFSDAIFHLTGTPCMSLKTKLYSTPQHKCSSSSSSSTSSPSSSSTSSASLAFWNELRKGMKNGSLMLNICTSRNHYEENLSKYLRHQTKNDDDDDDDDGPSASSFSTSNKRNIIVRIGHAYSVVDGQSSDRDVDGREDEVKKEKKVLVVRDPALSVEKKKKLRKLITSSSTSCSPTFFELNFDKLISSSSSSRHLFGGQEMFFHRGSAWLGFSNMKLLHKEIFTMMTNRSSETDTDEQTCRSSSDLHHRDVNLSFFPSTTTTKRILFHLRQFGGNGTDDDDDDDDDDDRNKSLQALKLLLLPSKKNDQAIVIASSGDKFQRRRDVFLDWHDHNENQENKLMMRIASMKKDKAKPTTGRMALLVFEILE